MNKSKEYVDELCRLSDEMLEHCMRLDDEYKTLLKNALRTGTFDDETMALITAKEKERTDACIELAALSAKMTDLLTPAGKAYLRQAILEEIREEEEAKACRVN